MKKFICLVTLMVLLTGFVQADSNPDPNRKISTGLLSSNGTIITSPVYLFDVCETATAVGGWVAVFNDNTGVETTTNQLVELREGVQYNGKCYSPNKYAGEGLEIQVNNANAIATIIDKLIQAFLLLGICGWMPGMSQAGFQLEVLDLGAPLLFGFLCIYGKVREFSSLIIGILIAICIWTSAWLTLNEYPVNFIHIMAGCLVYYTIINGIRNPRSIAKALVLAGIINMVIALFQKIGYDPIYTVVPINFVIQKQHLSMAGLMGRNYHFAYLLAVTTPLAFYLDLRLGLFYGVIAGLFIWLVGSYAVMLIFAITILFALSRWVNFKILGVIIIISILVVVISLWHTILGKIEWRLPAYLFCIRDSFINPFIGHGLGSFDATQKFDSSFNPVLKMMYDLGLIPVIFLIIMTIKYYMHLLVPYKSLIASAVALVVYTLFHDTTIFARLMILSIAILALCEVENTNS